MKYPVLAIETTGLLASVALRSDEAGNIYSEGLTEKLNHLKGLLPLTDKVLVRAGLNINDIKTIAVSHGPGSFTGIRIGISTVRAIAQMTGAKVIGVPTLEAFIYNLPDLGGIVCPVFDARMNQLYGGAFVLENNRAQYRDAEDMINTLIKTDSYSGADFCGRLTGVAENLANRQTQDATLTEKPEFRFFGDGLDVFRDDINNWGESLTKKIRGFSFTFEENNNLQLATSVLKWAENFGHEKGYEELFPVYVRKAEAQRKLDEKNAGR